MAKFSPGVRRELEKLLVQIMEDRQRQEALRVQRVSDLAILELVPGYEDEDLSVLLPPDEQDEDADDV